jgi:hypothetical protein
MFTLGLAIGAFGGAALAVFILSAVRLARRDDDERGIDPFHELSKY